MNTSKYVPHLQYGTRVRFVPEKNHPKNGEHCTIIGVLPNPSKRAENQWYDVRFEDYSIGRAPERCLVRVDTDDKEGAA